MKVLKGLHLILPISLLLASAVLTTPALADGGAPPPTNTTSSSSSTRLPTGTSLVVLDGSGHKIPLGSQFAIQLIASGDPVWCPSTLAAPTPGANGCTASSGNLASLVSYLSGHQKAMNGTIWITGGADSSSGTISLSASTFTTMSLYALTLKGGWNGTSGSATIIPASPSTFGQTISISSWQNNVTLSDIQTNNTPSADGLDISTTKNITLLRFQANNNLNVLNLYGATLDNSSGTGSVSITKSVFNSNNIFGGVGLQVISHGAVTLSSVTADGNYGGIYIDNTGAPTAQPVKLLGTNDISGNGGAEGLDIFSHGAITVSNLTANSNAGYGALLDNCNFNGTVCTTPSAQPVSLLGTNTFNSNTAGDGLDISSRGAITVYNVNASLNTAGKGANLDNSNASTTQPVYLYGSNNFDFNSKDGLDVTSRGAITANSLAALSNSNGFGTFLTSYAGSVTLTGSNSFDSNKSGLEVLSAGPIKANNIAAESNSGGDGAYLDNCLSFGTCTGSGSLILTGSNTFSGNGFMGLFAYSNGQINLNNVTAELNANIGAEVDNHTGATTSLPVYLTGSSTFNSNGQDGLDIYSNGAINGNNLTADSNPGYGALLDNCNGTTCTTPSVKPVLLTGVNTFNANTLNGLKISSRGLITASNLTANSNKSTGAQLDNTQGTAGVTLTGTNIFSANTGDGLYLTSKGAILLYSIVADTNTAFGAEVYNYTASLTPSVTLAGTNEFKLNGSEGLAVSSRGIISVRNITASLNSSVGANLNNTASGAGSPQSVILSGVNAFYANGSYGLEVNSDGAIAVNNLTADGNGTSSADDGVDLYNLGATAAPITVGGTNVFDGNLGRGLIALSNGTITIHSVIATENGGNTGVFLSNTGSGTSGVVVSGINVFNENAATGLEINTSGAVSLSNVTANGSKGNGSTGVSVTDNGAGEAVTVSGTNMFLGDALYGLFIQSQGLVSIAKTSADHNGSVGLAVNTTGSIKVDCGSFVENASMGADLNAGGTITLISVFAYGNAGGDIVTSSTPIVYRACTLP